MHWTISWPTETAMKNVNKVPSSWEAASRISTLTGRMWVLDLDAYRTLLWPHCLQAKSIHWRVSFLFLYSFHDFHQTFFVASRVLLIKVSRPGCLNSVRSSCGHSRWRRLRKMGALSSSTSTSVHRDVGDVCGLGALFRSQILNPHDSWISPIDSHAYLLFKKVAHLLWLETTSIIYI